MDVAAVIGLVEVVEGVPLGCRDRARLSAGVSGLRRLMSWCEARQVQLARDLAVVSSFPEKDLAEASRTDVRDAVRAVERAAVVEQVPELGESLSAGTASAAHVDIVGAALRGLKPVLRLLLEAQADKLAVAAESMTPDEFRGHVTRLVARIEADAGVSRHQRRQRDTRLRLSVDHATGMGRLFGVFDPESFARLHRRLHDTVAALFAETVPDHCPTDPIAKQEFLRAHALLALVSGNGGGVGRPEFIAVIDTRAANGDGGPVVDVGIPVEVPLRVLADLAGDADVHAVVVRNGIIVHAPGELNLGRTTRIANRAQRRALRAVYPTCGVPGCSVGYDLCKIHHIIWWRLGGRTDLDNLIPLCWKHHHAVHDDGWQLSLASDRALIITLPDGTRLSTGPPTRKTA